MCCQFINKGLHQQAVFSFLLLFWHLEVVTGEICLYGYRYFDNGVLPVLFDISFANKNGL
jgi:hypothetical protein